MADTAQDRQLPATERKINKARADGQVARSRDLGHLFALGGGVVLLAAFAPQLSRWFGRLLADGLRFDAATLARPDSMAERLLALVLQMLLVLLPMGAAIALLALAAGMLAGGWNFTLKPLAPKFEKLNPLAGLQRLFSLQHLGDTLKACVLALLLGAAGAIYLKQHWPQHVQLMAMPLPAALAEGGNLLHSGLLLLGGVLVVFAIVDVPWQRQMLLKRLRMNVEELKKEMRDAEGNTEVKGQMRARMREMGQRRMLAAVPQADLVVMNPTHYAVALKYEEGTMGAPRVVAKGADLMAQRIREAATAAKVPVLQAAPLARALYAHCEVDQEVPARLFGAVAQVLAWVYQLRDALAAGRTMNTPMPVLDVPGDMDPLHNTGAAHAEPAL
jgi:flagellar biosynthesis protein FlhB